MFKLSSRRYTGAKTRLLTSIENCFLRHLKALENTQNLSFFDVFAGTGVVSEHFIKHYTNALSSDKKPHFSRFIINDFLHSNYAIYRGFFEKENFNDKKLHAIKEHYNALKASNLKANYYEKSFGSLFFSQNDAKLIGFIRDDLDRLLNSGQISQKEFFILLSSLIYSSDRIANTVGHYDAYRKNIHLQDRFKFELIKPLKTPCEVEIFKEDSNLLAQNFAHNKERIDLAFIDPPYNSRQYSRFYHLLENLTQNKKPKLYGIAKKPEPKNLSSYCTKEAKEAFENLIENLSNCAKILIITYNNTYSSKSSSSQNKITLEQITQILSSFGKIFKYEFDYKAFSSGKTDFKNHKEMIFVCELG